jgi:hypothetical protein
VAELSAAHYKLCHFGSVPTPKNVILVVQSLSALSILSSRVQAKVQNKGFCVCQLVLSSFCSQ